MEHEPLLKGEGVVQISDIPTEKRYSINEIFGPTIQGEGALLGARTHFIRFNGCDYRCKWCDTLDAVLPERIKEHNTPMLWQKIVQEVEKLGPAEWVTLSGGNPALVKNMSDIMEPLKNMGYKIALETQGSVAQRWFKELDHLVLSPKPPSSGMKFLRYCFDECLGYSGVINNPIQTSVCIKVVVFDEQDLDFAVEMFKQYEWAATAGFYLQLGSDTSVPEDCDERALLMLSDYRSLWNKVKDDPRFAKMRLTPQWHKYVFGHGRGV